MIYQNNILPVIYHCPNLKNWLRSPGTLLCTGESGAALVQVLRKSGGLDWPGPAVGQPQLGLWRTGATGAAAADRSQGSLSVDFTCSTGKLHFKRK